jgi:hypothetical protein
MVVMWKQLYQIVEQVHDCHHDKHSLPMVGLMFMVVSNEWLRVLLGLSTQLVRLHFDVVHWLFPFVLHSWLVHS